jgi:Raf kinase inhibitor-like YbhB/YbcL family protein
MWRALLQLILIAAAAGCGASGGKAISQFHLSSSAFADGQPIPAQYTCDGDDLRPPLDWSGAPAGTKSFALVVDDPDAPDGTFRHWAIYDIPATADHLGDQDLAAPEATNDFGKSGYGGPCPPKGHGPHRYRFKLYALDTDRLGIPANAKVEDVENAARQHAIGKSELVGTYERK